MKIAVALFLLLVVSVASATDITVVWKNATTYNDGSSMPSADIVSSTVTCGLTQASQTLSVTVTGPAQTAVVPNALAGKTYVCGVSTNSQNFGSSTVAFSNNVVLPAKTPAPPTNVGASLATTGPTAYVIEKSKDRFVALPAGTLPVGTPCDATQPVLGFYAVPSAAVKWSGTVRSLAVVASCG